MYDCDLGAGSDRKMRELEGDVAAADEYQACGHMLEVEELVAVDREFLAGDMQRSGRGARRNGEVSRGEPSTVHLDGSAVREPGESMERGDAGRSEALFPIGWNGIGERVFKAHQFRPIDAEVAGYAAALHATRPVEDLRAAHQNLFRVAAAIRAGSAKGARIYDGNAPAGFAARVSDRAGGRAGANHDEVEVGHSSDHPTPVAGRATTAGWLGTSAGGGPPTPGLKKSAGQHR